MQYWWYKKKQRQKKLRFHVLYARTLLSENMKEANNFEELKMANWPYFRLTKKSFATRDWNQTPLKHTKISSAVVCNIILCFFYAKCPNIKSVWAKLQQFKKALCKPRFCQICTTSWRKTINGGALYLNKKQQHREEWRRYGVFVAPFYGNFIAPFIAS